MPYLNIDDAMDEHPKVDGLSDAAYRMLMAGLHYCARQLTDGFIPHARARRLTVTASDAVAKELVDAGLWHDLGEGCDVPECIEERTCHQHGRKGHYIAHDYLQWNHSKEWWEKRRADEAERLRKWRAKAKREREAKKGSVQTYVRPYETPYVRGPEPEPEPEPEPISISLTPAVDGSPDVTDLQTARARRAQTEEAQGDTA